MRYRMSLEQPSILYCVCLVQWIPQGSSERGFFSTKWMYKRDNTSFTVSTPNTKSKVPNFTATPALKFVVKMLEDNPKLFQVGIDMGLKEADAHLWLIITRHHITEFICVVVLEFSHCNLHSIISSLQEDWLLITRIPTCIYSHSNARVLICSNLDILDLPL